MMEKTGTTSLRKPRPAWAKRLLRGAVFAIGAVLLYAVLAGVVAPRIVRSQAERRLSALVGGPVTIGQVAFHPFALRARVTDFRLGEPDGRPLLVWSNLVVDVELASVWRGELVLAAVGVDRLRLDVRREGTNRINVLELVKRLQAASPPAPTPSPAATNTPAGGLFPLVLQHLGFTNGVVAFRDETLSEPFEVRLEPIDFELENLTTRARDDGQLVLSAAGDKGERIDLRSRIRIDPLLIEGSVRGRHLTLPRPRPYLERVSPLRLAEGTLEFDTPFRIALADRVFDAAITNMSLSLTNLVVVEGPTNAPFAEVRSLAMDGIEVSLAARSAQLGSLRLDGGTLHVRREKTERAPVKGEFNLRGLIQPAAIEELVAGLTDWRLRLGEARFGGIDVKLVDSVLDPALHLGIEGLEARVANLSNHTNANPVTLEAGLRWAERGSIRVRGEGTIFPARARVGVDLQELALAPLAPYAAQVVRLELNRGNLGGALEAEYGGATNGPLVRGRGRVALTDFAATETGTGADFIRWDAIEANGLSVTAEPGRVDLEDLVIRKLQTSLVVTTNGQLNVLQLLRETRELTATNAPPWPSTEPATAPTTAAVTPPPGPSPTNARPTAVAAKTPGAAPARPFWEDWPVRLGRLKLEQVALFASDQYYGGGFRSSVESLDGEIREIALPPRAPAVVDLKGRLSAVSDFTAKGTIQPDPARFAADLTVTTRRADLTQFTPYSIRFAGYPVTKGELTAEVRYRIEGEALKAENNLRLEHFTLGAKTKSPDAIDLPLKLGVALLKDADGRIQLDVPLSGTLGDPQFRVAPLIWQVIRNLIVKATTAPFRFLGSLFGGGQDDDLEFVEFTPGTVEFLSGQTNRLRTLVRALQGRPQLSLAVLPGFDPAADKGALATNKVEWQLRALRRDEMVASGAAVPPVEQIGLPPEEHDRLLPVLYVKLFGALPTTAPAGTNSPATNAPAVTVAPTALAPAETPPPPPPAPVWSPAQLKQRLVETCIVEPADFKALARRRAEAVRALLTAQDAVAADRVSIDAEATGHPAEGKPRVAFRLE